MNNLSLAFLMGLLGSLHCAVMCGPIMLSLPIHKKSFFQSAIQVISYQIGRILIYVILGVFVGFIGNHFILFANQQLLSLTIGLFLIAFTLIQFNSKYSQKLAALKSTVIKPLSKLMGLVFGLPLWGFFAGMLNGLIPCGMVFLALVSALNTASIKGGAIFMFLFGLGTTPLMLMLSLGGIFLKKYINYNTKKLIPWFMLFVGALLILRSANLNIPFFSPNHQTQSLGTVKYCN